MRKYNPEFFESIKRSSDVELRQSDKLVSQKPANERVYIPDPNFQEPVEDLPVIER